MVELPAASATILIIGLGNPILGDDGVGWRVAEAVKNKLETEIPDVASEVDVDFLSVGGLSLMERMVGYQKAILIDAIMTNQHPEGTVLYFPLAALPNRAFGHLCSSHDTTLQNALEIGRRMGASLPDLIEVVGVEAREVYDFSEDLSPEVAQAVPLAVDFILKLILEEGNDLT
jgi:hydrogenase maturation protease